MNARLLLGAVLLVSLAAPVAAASGTTASTDAGPDISNVTIRGAPNGTVEAVAASRQRARRLSTAGDDVVVLELAAATPDRVERIGEMGATIQARHGDLVQARVGDASRYAALPWVEAVRDPRVASGSVVSEGVEVVAADELHARNVTGRNVSVGVIDEGFNVSNPEIAGNVRDYRSMTGDITAGGATQHGTAVSEIVVDVAPEADLYLTNVRTGIEFVNAVDWLIDRGVDVISVSLGYFAQPHDGTGFIAQAADNASGSGITFVASAGNQADRHWEDTYANPDGDEWVNINGSNEANFINDGDPVEGAVQVQVTLTWRDWPRASTDLDLYLMQYNPGGEDVIVANSTRRQDGTLSPTETISTSVSGGVYYVAIAQVDPPTGRSIEVFTAHHSLQNATPRGSIVSPSTANRAVAVGAFGHRDGEMEPFSSRGPTNDGRRGVDVVAPDGVSTTAYDGGFFGTSASAPHVAGVAALLRAESPGLSANATQGVINRSATDILTAGPDLRSGYGKVNATAAAALLEPNVSVTGVSVSPETVAVGGPVRVNATLRNTGPVTGSTDVALYVDGERRATRRVEVGAGQTATATFETSFDSAGAHQVSIDGAHNASVNVTEPLSLSVGNATGQANSTATVGFELRNTANASVSEVSLTIDRLPPNWTVAAHADDGGQWRNDTREWLWLDLAAGSSVRPDATLRIPNRTAPGDYRVAASATDGTNTVSASGTVTVSNTTALSVAAAIAGDNRVIDTAEILQAIDYWSSNEAVPGTGGKTVSTATILQLISTWASGEQV